MIDMIEPVNDPTQDTCPMCGGPGVALGTLGYMLHLRCRDCGSDFIIDSPDSYDEE